MRIAVTGATGLIGTRLCQTLQEDGHSLVVYSRSRQRANDRLSDVDVVEWHAESGPVPANSLDGVDAVINLAGASIAAKRWSEVRKRTILESRVTGTRNLVAGLLACQSRPSVLINGSATGFYGSRGDENLTEQSSPGSGFLPDVCRQWEEAAQPAVDGGIRTVFLRTGIVLSTEGGALEKMLPPFKMFVGGPLGSGQQYMSWIHIADEVELIRFALANEKISGPLNGTAPNPVTNKEFSSTLGRSLGRPAFLPAPGFALKLMLGEMAGPLLLEGQRVHPEKAQESGYSFRFPELAGALSDLLE